jgi:DNA-binding PadR family transcriptional regulator
VVERELRPVVMAARLNRQTLILAHHLHKSGGQHGTEVAGGHAIIGGVDGYLSLLRDPHHEFRRIVRGTVRRIKVEELVYEMIKDGEFLVLGERREVERVELRRNALQVLSKANEPWNLTQVCSALSERGVKEHSKRVRAALDWLTEQGFAVRDPAEEKKGKTYKWQITDAGRQWLQDTTQAATQSQATPDPVNQAALQNYLNELDENW